MPCCELCGKEMPICKEAVIDGVRMMVCPDCMKYGEAVKPVAKAPTQVEKYAVKRARGAKGYDVFKKMDKELVPDWPRVIKKAREKKGLSREELGFRIGERTVIISKLENGDLRPPDKMIEKLEKELGISLTEEVKQIASSGDRSYASGMTLGDFLKNEK